MDHSRYFRAFSEVSSDLFFVVDFSGCITFASRAAERMLGYLPEQVVGLSSFAFIHPDDLPSMEKHFGEIIQSRGKSRTIECRVRHRDGSWRWIETSNVVPDETDDCAIIVCARDVTERKELATELHFRALLIDMALDSILAIASDGSILFANETACTSRGYVKEEMLRLNIRDLVAPGLEDTVGPRIARILHDGYEVFEILHRRKDGTTFPVEARARGITIGEKRMLVSVTRDLTARKEQEQALRLNEARYRSVVEDQSELICRFLPDTTLTFVNDAHCRFYGVSREEVIGRRFLPLVPLSEQESTRAYFASFSPARPAQSHETKTCIRDGSIRWMHWSDRAFFDDRGQITEFQSVGRDITQRKQAMEALRQSEETARVLLNTPVDAMIYLTDPTGVLIDLNEALAAKLQKAPEELIGTCLFEHFTAREIAFRKDRLDEAERTGKPVFFEECRLGAWFENVIYPVSGPGPSIVKFVHYTRDITARKQAEAVLRKSRDELEEMVRERTRALAESEARFREMADLMPQPLYEADLRGTITFTNRAGFERFGYSRDGLSHGFSIFDMIIPEERDLARRNIADILEGKKPLRCNEYSALRKDGSCFPVIMSSAPIVKNGVPAGLRGVIIDITDRVRTEKTLRESELKLRQLAENISEVFWLRDLRTGEILYVSPAYEVLFGRPSRSLYDDAEAFLACVHPSDAAKVRETMRTNASRGPVAGEFRIIRPDGVERWIRARTFLVRNADGEVSREVGVAEDITERKRADEALRAHAEQLQAFSTRLIEARESERRFIARELHDEIGQHLTGLMLSLDMLTARRMPQESLVPLSEIRQSAADLLDRVRNLSLDLRPTMLDDLGLLPALYWHFKRFLGQTGVTVRFRRRGRKKRYHQHVETVVYRIVQEALTNVARHAGVHEAVVSLEAGKGDVQVRIADRGSGFDPVHASEHGRSVGLISMRERVEAIGGTFVVRSERGAGTVVAATIPSPAPERNGLWIR